jgi:hypothetical protein
MLRLVDRFAAETLDALFCDQTYTYRSLRTVV